MNGRYIYGVLQVPNDINYTVCPSAKNDTGPSVYHCASGVGSGCQFSCPAGQWCFANCTYRGGNQCSCVTPYVPGDTTSPTPYNWMAGLVAGYQANQPSTVIPAVNKQLPHNLPATADTGLGQGNAYAAFTDSPPAGSQPTPYQTNNSSPQSLPVPSDFGTAFIIVAYDVNWFSGSLATGTQAWAAIDSFYRYGWKNSSQGDPTVINSPYTYGGNPIQTIEYQVYNNILLGASRPTGLPNGFCSLTNTSAANCLPGVSAPCSNFYANQTATGGVFNYCNDVIQKLFINQSTEPPPPQPGGAPSGLYNLLGNYSNSSAGYCTTPNNVNNNDCLCINRDTNSTYEAILTPSTPIPGLTAGNAGCWWQACRSPNTNLPEADVFIWKSQSANCTEQICATIIDATKGKINNSGSINQLINCSGGTGGGGGPTNYTWLWVAAGVFFVLVVVVLVIVLVVRKGPKESVE